MTAATREDAILSKVRQELEAEGYEVLVRPNRLAVPAFLGTFVPDALAFGKEKNVVVEVATQSPQNEVRLSRLRGLVEREPNWDLRLIWVSAGIVPRSIPEADFQAILSTLEEVEILLQHRQPRAAMLLSWGCFEAIARKMMPSDFSKPQTPGRIVEKLALEGHITPAEATELREFSRRRNRLIHGDLRTEVRRRHVAEMITILRRLVKDAELIVQPDTANG
jgi:uncharacterized protein YutE (UPF0331/DUF86 family)